MQTLDAEMQLEEQCPAAADFEPLARLLLEPCAKHEAQKATTIRKQLKMKLGRWQAEAVLSFCSEVCLRSEGVCSRYFVDSAGMTLRLRPSWPPSPATPGSDAPPTL